MPDEKKPSAPLPFPRRKRPVPVTGPPILDVGQGQALSTTQMIADACEAVQEHIRRQPHVQRVFSFMPTLMTRVSPFHFRNKNTYKDWPLVRLDSGSQNTWGRMTVVGELLVIFDETVLFCLLALLQWYQSDAFETTEEDICRLAEVTATQANRNAVWKSIQRLSGTRIDLALMSGRGKRKKTTRQMTGSILTYCDRNRDSGTLRVAVNPYFLNMYGDSFVTNIDLQYRQSLKHDVAKALYRFFQGQVKTAIRTNLARLARAINLDTGMDQDQTWQRKIRTGLKMLKKSGYLASLTIDDSGNVALAKSAPVKQRPSDLILG